MKKSQPPPPPSPAVIAFVSRKGSQGKSSTALHVAAFLSALAPTVLVDGDSNGSALNWQARGKANGYTLPFEVLPPERLAEAARATYCVLDTRGEPEADELAELREVADLLVCCSTPEALCVERLLFLVQDLRKLGVPSSQYRALLTSVPPSDFSVRSLFSGKGTSGEEDRGARALLKEEEVPVLKTVIRRYAVWDRAALAGCLVNQVRGASPYNGYAWNDCKALGKELIEVAANGRKKEV